MTDKKTPTKKKEIKCTECGQPLESWVQRHTYEDCLKFKARLSSDNIVKEPFYTKGYEKGKSDTLAHIKEEIEKLQRDIMFHSADCLTKRHNDKFELHNNGVLEFGVDILDKVLAIIKAEQEKT